MAEDLKITNVQCIILDGNFPWPLVRIDTDAGISGYGESFPTLKLDNAKGNVLDRRERMIGEDPTNVVPLVNRLGMNPFDLASVQALSGIEMALWDITGKVYGLPVWKLLGGKVRDEVRIYCDCHGGTPIRTLADYSYDHPENYTPEAFAKNAEWVKSLGFSFLKFDLYGIPPQLVPGHGAMYSTAQIDYCTSVVAALRDAVGWDHDLAIDYGGKSVADAIRIIDQVESFRLSWAEDIIAYNGYNADAMAEVTDAVKTPTLTGELIPTAVGFRDLIHKHAVRVVAPDMTVVGGLNQTLLVAEMARQENILVAPHNITTPIGTMAAVHACAAMPNFVGLEFHAVGLPWWQDLVHHEGDIIDDRGYIQVPDTPGIGVEPNKDEMLTRLMPGESYFEE